MGASGASHDCPGRTAAVPELGSMVVLLAELTDICGRPVRLWRQRIDFTGDVPNDSVRSESHRCDERAAVRDEHAGGRYNFGIGRLPASEVCMKPCSAGIALFDHAGGIYHALLGFVSPMVGKEALYTTGAL